MWFVNELKNKIIKTSIFVLSFCIGLISINFYFDLPPIENVKVKDLFQNVKDYKLPKVKHSQPNPLILVIKADKERNLFINNEKKGTLDDFSLLKNGLELVFNNREIYQVLNEETNEVEKEVIIQPKDTIVGKDLINLIEVLEQSGANPIIIDWNDELIDKGGGGA